MHRTAAVLVALAGSAASAQLFPAQFELSSLDGGDGFVLNGVDPGDLSGLTVSSAGDVNGDGVDDVIISAHNGDPNAGTSGESYVVFGGAGVGAGGTIELSSLDGTNGFVLNGIDANDQSGRSVSAAGDVNGDGVDDLVIGSHYADPNGASSGESYVVFGGAGVGAGGAIELSSLDGTNGFVLNGINGGDRSGFSVSSAGDVNGDGVDDLFIGAPYGDPNGSSSGESYVIFGGAGVGAGGAIGLSSLDGSNGFVLNGINGGDQSGRSVSAAGDVNGDGVDDLIIGARSGDPNGSSSGESYVIFGGAGVGASGAIELSSLDGTNGFVLNGIDPGDVSGESVSTAGDVNGDGVDDLIIGAPYADPAGRTYAGESYVIFGGAGVGAGGTLELSSLDGTNGFVLNGIDANDQSGRSVSIAGDMNGDGVDDLIIGAYRADPNVNSSGESYVVFGGAGVGAGGAFELSSLDGTNGFVLNGFGADDRSGGSVSSAGDVNGDGVDDVIIGAFLADPNGDTSGQSYVVFGRTANSWISPVDGAFGTDSNWSSGEVPTGGPVFITPVFGVTVTGPAGALAIDLLALGADVGRTEFAMQPGSLIEIEDEFVISSSATLSGSGALIVDEGLLNDGLLEPTDLTVFSAGGVVNNAELRLEALVGLRGMELYGLLTNEAGGDLFIRGATTLETTLGLVNDGTITLNFADTTVRGPFSNNADIVASGATRLSVVDDLTNDGSFVLSEDSSVSINGDLSGSGVTGPGGGAGGTVFIGGTFTPARAMEAGLAAFGGDVSLGTGSATAIDLASAGSFDEITSLGAVNIAGDLMVNLLGGYEPQAGDSFTLVSAASVTGVFASESLPVLTKGLEWDLVYTAGEVVLSVLGGNPADLNGDGCVDSADLAILLAAWAGPGADLNGDNVTDSADLAILLAAWGGCV